MKLYLYEIVSFQIWILVLSIFSWSSAAPTDSIENESNNHHRQKRVITFPTYAYLEMKHHEDLVNKEFEFTNKRDTNNQDYGQGSDQNQLEWQDYRRKQQEYELKLQQYQEQLEAYRQRVKLHNAYNYQYPQYYQQNFLNYI